MTDTLTLGLPSDAIPNPYGVPDELDAIRPVMPDVPAYSETIALSTWNPADGVGVFLHAGRCPQDLDLWWAQIVVYLPDGQVAASRGWGRCAGYPGIRTGDLDLRMPGGGAPWHATFDGAAEITHWTAMLDRPAGAGRARPIRWDLRTAPAGPVWDMYAVLGRGGGLQDWAAGMHVQQVITVEGTLVVDGREHQLDGVGWKDHSAGPRHMSSFGRDHFLGGSFPGQALHCLSVFGPDGAPLMEAGTLHGTDGTARTAVLVDVPPLSDLAAVETEFDAALRDDAGNRTSVHVEVLATLAMTISDDNDNINGVDWTGDDLLTLLESRVRLTTADGAVGYAHLERGARRRLLTHRSAPESESR